MAPDHELRAAVVRWNAEYRAWERLPRPSATATPDEHRRLMAAVDRQWRVYLAARDALRALVEGN